MSGRVPLTQGLFALVDDEDLERVSAFKWRVISMNGRPRYAMRTIQQNGAKQTLYMHRWIIDAPTGAYVDHKNGNGFDNRRDNLRLATSAQNATNYRRTSPKKTSRFHGVCLLRGRWLVVICAGPKRKNGNAKKIQVGTFVDETDAARAYDRAALKHHGEFAVTNFPREDYV